MHAVGLLLHESVLLRSAEARSGPKTSTCSRRSGGASTSSCAWRRNYCASSWTPSSRRTSVCAHRIETSGRGSTQSIRQVSPDKSWFPKWPILPRCRIFIVACFVIVAALSHCQSSPFPTLSYCRVFPCCPLVQFCRCHPACQSCLFLLPFWFCSSFLVLFAAICEFQSSHGAPIVSGYGIIALCIVFLPVDCWSYVPHLGIMTLARNILNTNDFLYTVQQNIFYDQQTDCFQLIFKPLRKCKIPLV